MPVYEYRCTKCETRFEVLQKVGADGSKLSCPQCGAKAPEKLLSMFASSMSGSSGGGCKPGSGFT